MKNPLLKPLVNLNTPYVLYFQVISSNGAFRGTFFLHEFLEGNGAGRSVACIEEEGCTQRLTPGEAEERAGLGSNKNWKKTIMVINSRVKIII